MQQLTSVTRVDHQLLDDTTDPIVGSFARNSQLRLITTVECVDMDILSQRDIADDNHDEEKNNNNNNNNRNLKLTA